MLQRRVPIVILMALLPALAATEQSLKTLVAVDSVDAYAALGAEDIRSQVSTVLLATDPRLKSLSLEPGRQELVAAVRFDGSFPEAHVTLAAGAHAVHREVRRSHAGSGA